ncbi:MAG: quinol:electron acceptor oxidoreductase subunit ActD [Bryobacteraceae bacterium]
MYLTGDFQQKEATIQALRKLTANGFGPSELDVFSDEPLEFPRGVLDRPTRMSLGVVAGAIMFCLLAIGFVFFTQYNYPLVTGGMPLFSFWGTGVVFYEMTMLGAILTAFTWFLAESGLLRRHRKAPVPSMEPGMICVRVHCQPNQVDDAGRFLEGAGAINVRKIGDSA